MAFRDPVTWPEPTQGHTEQDRQYGTVRVMAWSGLHGVVRDHPDRGSRAPRPIVRGSVILVEVTRLPGWTREPQRLWLFYFGPGSPDLAIIWRAYVHRFDLEHTLRFFKQTLNWTAPPTGFVGAFRRFSWHWVLQRTRQSPVAAPPDAPRVAVRDGQPAARS